MSQIRTIDELLFKIRTTREVELNDNRWEKEFVYSIEEARQAIKDYIAKEIIGSAEIFDKSDKKYLTRTERTIVTRNVLRTEQRQRLEKE